MDIGIDTTQEVAAQLGLPKGGRIVMEMRGDVVPKTCENFRQVLHFAIIFCVISKNL
jgi:hypothetical protein